MNNIVEKIKTQYPKINTARTFLVQRDYYHASEIYSQLLEEISEKEPQDSLILAVVYVEYAKSLILSSDKLVLNPEVEEDQGYLEDLEIAWEVLELSKQIYISHNIKKELIEVYTLLAEISHDNNNYKESQEDYLNAYSLSKETEGYTKQTLDLYFRVAILDQQLENTPEAIRKLKEILTLLDTHTDQALKAEMIEEVKERINQMENPEKYTAEHKINTTPIDLSGPVQRITTTKTKPPQNDK